MRRVTAPVQYFAPKLFCSCCSTFSLLTNNVWHFGYVHVVNTAIVTALFESYTRTLCIYNLYYCLIQFERPMFQSTEYTQAEPPKKLHHFLRFISRSRSAFVGRTMSFHLCSYGLTCSCCSCCCCLFCSFPFVPVLVLHFASYRCHFLFDHSSP